MKLTIKISFTIFIILLFCFSCKSLSKTTDDKTISKDYKQLVVLTDTFKICDKNLPRPSAPLDIIDAKDRAIYEAMHYWDNINLRNDSVINDTEVFKNSIVNFVGLLTSLNLKDAQKAVVIPLDKSIGHGLRLILTTYFNYLYRYNSPLQNLKLYQTILEWSVKNKRLIPEERARAKDLLETIQHNDIGSVAEDFDYTGLDSVKRKLSRGFAPLTLLIFYDPNCHVCQHEAISISKNEDLEKLANTNTLDILFISLDRDPKEVQAMSDIIPRFAKIGIAPKELISKGLYDIQAVPSIYLLDGEKKVLLRDCKLTDAIAKILEKSR